MPQPGHSAARREREQQRHRREILQAAVEAFAERGFHAAGVAEIAQAAQFGVGTLYRLFPGGKEELYLALKERVVAAFEQALEREAAGAAGPAEAVAAYIRASVAVYAGHPREMAMYLQEVAGLGFDLGAGLPPELRRRYRACAGVARRALDQARQAGLLRSLEPEAAFALLRAVINGLAMHWLAGPGGPPAELARQMADAFWHGAGTDRRTQRA
jgi:AcrR family transcriptional regulator